MIVTKRKMERYREALDQGVLRDFPLAADLFLSECRTGCQRSAHSR